MRVAILAIVLAACAAQPQPIAAPSAPMVYPNRVCIIAATIEHGGHCDDLGRGVGPGHSDVALWHRDDGIKLCWETFDARSPLACPPLVLTKAEIAEDAVRADRAKQAEAAKQAAQATQATSATVPAKPESKPAKPEAKKP